jgi:hypothetical protein
VWLKEAVEKGAELSAWIKSAWHETVAVIEDGSGNLTSRYVGVTVCVCGSDMLGKRSRSALGSRQ